MLELEIMSRIHFKVFTYLLSPSLNFRVKNLARNVLILNECRRVNLTYVYKHFFSNNIPILQY